MTASISFIAQGPNSTINTPAGSGLGFYGSAGFGASVGVNAYQANTYVTDATGTQQGQQCHNTQYLNSASGIVDTATSGISITCFPNYQCPLNVRFTNSSPVKTQNAKLVIYDRTNINNAASGVLTYMAQVIHPDTVQNNDGSGDKTWRQFYYSNAGSGLPLVNSPGTSGLSPNGVNTVDTQHDWYVAISASPDSIGSKSLYGLFAYAEFL